MLAATLFPGSHLKSLTGLQQRHFCSFKLLNCISPPHTPDPESGVGPFEEKQEEGGIATEGLSS